MNLEYGDLIEQAKNGQYDVIIHGCNCFNTMGAGIAKQIKSSFPEAYQADLKTKKGDRNKLGTYTKATINNNDQQLTIVNAYTQYYYGHGKDLFEYDAFSKILKQIKAEFSGQKIGLPLIGCGYAGGNKQEVLKIIAKELENENYTIVEYQPELNKKSSPKFR